MFRLRLEDEQRNILWLKKKGKTFKEVLVRDT